MADARLDGAHITDWDTFHDACARALGFPDFYGRNMNAWIDCLTYLRLGDGMSRFALGPDEVLRLEVEDSDAFNRRAPEVFDAFVECTAAVNRRYREVGEPPAVHLVLL